MHFSIDKLRFFIHVLGAKMAYFEFDWQKTAPRSKLPKKGTETA